MWHRMGVVCVVLLAAGPRLALADPAHVQLGSATLTFGIGNDSESDKLDDLTLALARAGKTAWTLHGWKEIAAGRAMPEALTGMCETYDVAVTKQRLGKHDGVRLDIGCRHGEDMLVVQGIAILVDQLEPYHVLWMGDGDSLKNENDACVTEHTVTFQLSGKKLVERATDTTRTNADGSCTPDGKPGKPKVKKSRVVHAL